MESDMNALEDRRPVAAYTTASDNPSVIGEDLAQLLVEHPDIELASIRLIPNNDGTVGIAGRIGQLAGVECPQCHQPTGRPHTDFCTLAPDRVWPEAHPVGPRSRPGAHHAEDCPMRVGLVTTGCFCGREGQRDPAPIDCPCSYSAGTVEHSALCPSYLDSQP